MKLYLAQIIPKDKQEQVEGSQTEQYITKRGNFTAEEQDTILKRLTEWQKRITKKLEREVKIQIFVNDYVSNGEVKRKGIYLRLNDKEAYQSLLSINTITIEASNWKPSPEYKSDVEKWKKEQISKLQEKRKLTKDKQTIKAIDRDLNKVKKLKYIPICLYYQCVIETDDTFEVLDLENNDLYYYVSRKYKDYFQYYYPDRDPIKLLAIEWQIDCDFEQLIRDNYLVPLTRTIIVRDFDLSDLRFNCTEIEPYSNFDPKANYDLNTLVLLNVADCWSEQKITELFEPYFTHNKPEFEWHVAHNSYHGSSVIAYVKFEKQTNDARIIITYHKHETMLPTIDFNSFIKSFDTDTRKGTILPNNKALQVYLYDHNKTPNLISSQDYENYKNKLDKKYNTREAEVRAIVEYINTHNQNPNRTLKMAPHRNGTHRGRGRGRGRGRY